MTNKSELEDHEERIRHLEHVAEKIYNDLHWIKIICGGILTTIIIPVALRYLGLD